MIFTEPAFFVFLAAVFLGSVVLARWSPVEKGFLLAASLVYFATWGLFDVGLFIVTAGISYALIALMARAPEPRGRWLFIAVIVFNIGVLAVYKYARFLAVSLEGVTGLRLTDIGIDPDLLPDRFPLGISFYVFHLISYAVDIRDRKYPISSPFGFACYIAFFPHLLAGPIVRGGMLIPQFERRILWRERRIADGSFDFCVGLFFKVLADRIAPLADPFWTTASVADSGMLNAGVASLLFSFQIFGDFAGYSLMALGMARWLGYELPLNFRYPYAVGSFQEFWRHWHITLSQWLRDYLYIRVFGGSQHSHLALTYMALLATMVIGGLWHGPNWTFVAWGAIHGVALVVERLLGLHERAAWPVRLLWYVVVQVVVILAWIFFRSPTFDLAWMVLRELTSLRFPPLRAEFLYGLALILPMVAYHAAYAVGLRPVHPWLRAILAGLCLGAALTFNEAPANFLYFAF
ncbi:MBOAT family O-acyltransferase [Ferrovibrio sp.]|uniref:MBOAT family O-acyltransferase n=1 Tax=Ferrovibrio sp. TaxID=1917215 RepID=UPI003D265C11